MSNIADPKKALRDLINAIKTEDENRIDDAMYGVLRETTNMIEMISSYIFLSNLNLHIDFGNCVIKKGTNLYRIRRYETNVDFSKETQWAPPPSHPENRANYLGQEALYLASTETICLLETHVETGEKYAIGRYVCLDDILVGGFFSLVDNNAIHNIVGAILNAFLIAPARSEKNLDLFCFLDKHYAGLSLNDLIIEDINGVELPFKFATLNKREEYYKLTNKICSALLKTTPDGIRYSSCYIPMETPGIECSDYNIVLYSDGISKVKFKDFEIKTNNNTFTGADIIKVLINEHTEKDM